jgi:hypothetical protein
MSDDAELASFRSHMERCAQLILAPITRPDIKFTIIVRAPEALPSEAMIYTNDCMLIAAESLLPAEARKE